MSIPDPVVADELDKDASQSGFFTRTGGVSQGIYSGLNVGLGSDDDRNHVLENRSRVARYMEVATDALVSAYQIHSNDVITISEPLANSERPKVDGLVTNTPGIAIGILTADCGPVLFLDAENHVAGAAHAGWKGATGGILENTISAMETLGAERNNIVAVLGPTISATHYEVGPEFVERLEQLNPNNHSFLSQSTNAGHAMFDLPAYILDRLTNTGIAAHWTGHCTYADEKKFYSYRRKTHRKETDYGRQISAIALK